MTEMDSIVQMLYQPLTNHSQSATVIANVSSERTREAVASIICGITQFYEYFPSLLCSPLDLRYVAIVLIEQLEHMAAWLTNTMPVWDDTEDPKSRLPFQIDLTTPDVGRLGGGLRLGQAANFARSRMVVGFQSALETLVNRCQERERLTKVKVPVSPGHPVDLLFLVMAVDFALRPGQPARVLLDHWPDEYPGKFKPKPTPYEGPID